MSFANLFVNVVLGTRQIALAKESEKYGVSVFSISHVNLMPTTFCTQNGHAQKLCMSKESILYHTIFACCFRTPSTIDNSHIISTWPACHPNRNCNFFLIFICCCCCHFVN